MMMSKTNIHRFQYVDPSIVLLHLIEYCASLVNHIFSVEIPTLTIEQETTHQSCMVFGSKNI
jgi:hypothetical protein